MISYTAHIKFLLFAILFCVFLRFASAQTSDFSQTGQIRAIILETETKITSRKDTANIAGFKIPTGAISKSKYYFTYSTLENGAPTEKWIALSDDWDWSRLSNRSVRISGSLKNNKLSNAKASPLTEFPESYLTAPPPTAGLYKVVTVPLTIEPLSAYGKPGNEAAALNVTPAAIRDNLFNAPNSVNKFYLEASYGKFGFTGVHQPQAEVVPVIIQAAISDNCIDQIIGQFTPIVREKLRDQNIDTTNGSVDLGIIIFNNMPGCPDYPFATKGALGERGVPVWVWMPENWFVTGPAIMAHEIGHTLGAHHRVVARCTDFENPQTCVYSDAADRDFMTSAGRFYMMPNNYERRRWGWHPPGAFDKPSNPVYMFDLQSPALPFVKEGSRQGRFYFRNLTGAWSGWDIYPEARRNSGQFEKYQETDGSFRSGIAVRIGHSNYGDPSAISILLDQSGNTGEEDAPLRKNQQISIGGVTIKCAREHNPGWGTRMRVE